MKNKICLLLIALFLLTGCAVGSSEFSVRMDQVMKESSMRKATTYQNNHKRLYSYYLPVSMGKRESNSISTILEVSGYETIMNLNVENVLAERYYNGADVSIKSLLNTDLIYTKKGTYTNFEGKEQQYAIYINRLSNGTSFIVLKTNHFTYLTNVDFNDVSAVVQQLFTVARSTRINEEEIVSFYSRREVLNYDIKIVEIFQEKVPVNGDLFTLLQEENKEYDWTIDELDYLGNEQPQQPAGDDDEDAFSHEYIELPDEE